ncbi:MAG TPA: ABC transporter ATP-binding protein [Limnochordales bacterium]
MDIHIRHVRKTFRSADGEVTALRDINLTVPANRVTTLLGPSGCGKTTLLRCIAGLETPDSGEIAFGERVVWSGNGAVRTSVPPDQRGVGMVFQTYAIWPHMTVFENVAYPLEARRLPRDEIRRRVMEALAFVQLQGFERRPATALSGGQQQ